MQHAEGPAQVIDAFHLPGLELAGARFASHDYDGLELRYPLLDAAQLNTLVERLAAARAAYLADLPVREVVAVIDRAAARFADPGDPYRLLAARALPAVTGFSPEMTGLIIDRMAADWRAPALERLLRSEFDDPAVLDGFRRRADGGRWERALGPELVLHIFAGNVPGVSVTSLVRALLVKSASIGKCAAGEPLLAPLFARALAEVSPSLGACLAVTYWPGGTLELDDAALHAADVAVVYGGADTESAVHARLPATTRMLAHGPKLSFGVVGTGALGAAVAGQTAAAVALAAATFDQQGCVSPHLVYVVRGAETSPELFAELVAGQLAAVERDLPRGRLRADELAAIHDARASAEFRAIGGENTRLLTGADTGYTVIFDPDPAFTPSCLNRVLFVKSVASLAEVLEHIRPHAPVLQSVAVAGALGAHAGFAELLGRAGVSRVTTFERLPWPPAEWHHDGAQPLRDLVRWIDLEE